MGRPSKRGELLEAGVDIFQRCGYAAASVEEITKAAGVPKGALFNHFGSKEAFAIEALQRYLERWQEDVAPIVADSKMHAMDKLRALIAIVSEHAQASSYATGCLAGNFSAELSTEHDEIRRTLASLYRDSAAPFETIIAEGQRAGELSTRLAPERAARFIVNSLQGARLRSKVDREPSPLNDIEEIIFDLLLAPDSPTGEKASPRKKDKSSKSGKGAPRR